MTSANHREKDRNIGIALGSGSVRALAQIGILKALEEAGIAINYIAGTSMGALIGALYATDTLDEFEQFARQADWKTIASYCDFVFPRKGLIEGEKFIRLMARFLKDKKFEDTRIPFTAIATNLLNGEENRINSGPLVPAIRASISLPGILEPAKSNGHYMVDGGLVNPIPVNVVREMGADFVVAVDLNHELEVRNGERKKLKTIRRKNRLRQTNNEVATEEIAQEEPHWLFKRLGGRYRELNLALRQTLNQWRDDERLDEPTIFDVMANSINIMGYQISRHNLQQFPPDLLLQPTLGYTGLFDFDEAAHIIDRGYEYAKSRMNEIISHIYST